MEVTEGMDVVALALVVGSEGAYVLRAEAALDCELNEDKEVRTIARA